MLYGVLLSLQVFIAIGLSALVLLQHGKGADAGAAFGSGASSTVFGSQGSASFLTRATAALAILFFVNSLTLAWLVSHRSGEPESVVDRVPTEAPAPADTPAPQAPDVPPASESPRPVDVPE